MLPKIRVSFTSGRDSKMYPGWTPIGGQTQSAYVAGGTKKGDCMLSDRVIIFVLCVMQLNANPHCRVQAGHPPESPLVYPLVSPLSE
jgi:hypothetical protein